MEPLGILFGTKERNGTVGLAKCLESFEDGLGVVEDDGGRVKIKVGERLEAWILPLPLAILADEHVRSEHFAECDLGRI